MEDSLVADPDAVAAAVDGPALRSITARRRAVDIISKLTTKARVVVTMDGVACALNIYAPQGQLYRADGGGDQGYQGGQEGDGD